MWPETHIIPEPNTGCMLWLGTVDKDGYPRYGHSRIKPHRIVCAGLQPHEHACHHCDVRCCVNPEHIYRGSPQSNMDDKMQRGRWKGSRPSRLSADQVRAIRTDPRMYKEIAPMYGISKTMVGRIKRGEKLRGVF